MGRGIPTALLGRKLKVGGHANRTDAGALPTKVEVAPAPASVKPDPVVPEFSMNNTKAELSSEAGRLGIATNGLTKAQLLAAIGSV